MPDDTRHKPSRVSPTHYRPDAYKSTRKDERLRIIGYIHSQLDTLTPRQQVEVLRCVCTLLNLPAYFEGKD